jgi:hypothetical protein
MDDNEWILPKEPDAEGRNMVDDYNYKTNPGAWEEYDAEEWDYKTKVKERLETEGREQTSRICRKGRMCQLIRRQETLARNTAETTIV